MQFQTFDKNGDGVLTKEEIFEGYKNIFGDAVTEAEVVDLLIYYVVNFFI